MKSHWKETGNQMKRNWKVTGMEMKGTLMYKDMED